MLAQPPRPEEDAPLPRDDEPRRDRDAPEPDAAAPRPMRERWMTRAEYEREFGPLLVPFGAGYL
jgi:hypothetical protein